jgi:two-component system, LytTR family, sensor kinase
MKKNRIILEIIFFISIGLINMLSDQPKNSQDIFDSIFGYLFLYAHAIVNRIYILPYLFPQKKYGKYIIYTLINLTVFIALLYVVANFFSNYPEPATPSIFAIIKYAPAFILGLFVISSIEFVFLHLKYEAEKIAYEKTINQLENQNLKAQLNPHFLFNSLNNAYGMILQDPKRASNYVVQLSQLMRYQLESIKNPLVPLSDEIQFINNYLDVEKARIEMRCATTLDNRLDKHFINNTMIAPMIFSTYIENAIKHGASTSDPSWIKIVFLNRPNEIVFEISNSKPIIKTKTDGVQLGLQLAKQRLELLYADKHSIHITETQNAFTVAVKINL